MTSRTTTATASTTTAGLTTTRTAIVPNSPQPPTLGDVAPGLKRGSSGLEVTAIQQALAEHFPARISGRFDSDTDQQVRQFQKDRGLVVTGVVDEATLAALASAPGSSPHEALPQDGPAGTMVTTSARTLPGGVTETRTVFLPILPAAPELAEVSPNNKKGSVGPEVQTIQMRLQSWGFDVAVNSSFDVRTDKAVKQFQREMGLPESGVVDAATLTVMAREPGAGLASAHRLAGAASNTLALAADEEAKANTREKEAAGKEPVGYCAKHVRLALEQCGLGPGGGASAHEYGAALSERDNMVEIEGLSVAELEQLPPGAIIVYGHSDSRESGHVTVVSLDQTATGERLESSDHQQKLEGIANNRTYGTTFGDQQHETRFRVFMPVTTTSAP